MRLTAVCALFLANALTLPVVAQDDSTANAEQAVRGAIERALAYLGREVPQWPREHACYSCHNNGDATRALVAAVRAGYSVPRDAYQPTIEWLANPGNWEQNGPQGPFNDKALARLQFAAALGAAVEAGLVREPAPRSAGGDLLIRDQIPNGSWEFVGADEIGAPVTYGRFLATALAVQTLQRLDSQRFRSQIALGQQWLRNTRPRSVMNAAAVLYGLGEARDEPARRQQAGCVELVLKGEAPEGGWGPYVHSPPEAFDTALVVLALASSRVDGWQDLWRRGRASLVSRQLPDGSWPETTRPADGESYAQRLSTTGWATMALIVANDPSTRR